MTNLTLAVGSLQIFIQLIPNIVILKIIRQIQRFGGSLTYTKQMLGNGVEMSLIFRRILGPLVLGWAPNHFALGAQLAPGKKKG